MNSIEAVRDAIETLSNEEKIDEGQYLALMNHLKKVYELIAPSERKEDIPVFNAGAQRAMAIWEEQDEMGLSDITLRLFRVSLWGLTLRKNEDNVIAMRIICDGVANPDTFPQQDLEEVPKHVLALLCDKKWNEWVNSEVREVFLSNTVVRKWVVELNSMIKGNYSVKKYYRGSDTTMNGWTALLHHITMLPFQTLHKINRRGEVVDKNPDAITRLHPITIRFNIPNHPVIDLHLYTNRIQLGRSNINHIMCDILLSRIHQEGWTDVPMENLIGGAYGHRWPTPVMVVSGITARTRENLRSYTCCNNMVTITYDTPYSIQY